MTLLERCATIQSEIVRLESIELASKEAAQNRERHDLIQPLRIRLQDASERATTLRKSGIPFPPWPSQPKLIALFQDYARSLDDPETAKRTAFGSLNNALTALSDSAAEQVKKAVDALSVRNADMDDSSLKQFEGIPSLEPKVAAARAKRAGYLSVVQFRHRSLPDLLKFLELRADLLSLTSELQHQHLPAEVRQFYQAVQGGKATIDMLTEPIRSWLETNDQIKELRITLRPR